MSLSSDVHQIAQESARQTEMQSAINFHLMQIYQELARLNNQMIGLVEATQRIADALTPQPKDLRIDFKEKNVMAKTIVKMKAGKGMRSDQPAVHWSALSASGGIFFQLIDDTGADMPPPDVASVTTSLSVDDNTKITISKADELNYTVSKIAGSGGQIVLTAQLSFNDGSQGPFNATLPIILDTPGAADLKLKFTPA